MDVAGPIPELTPQCWAQVFSQLEAPDTARAACVQKLWRDLVLNDEQLWKHFVEKDLGVSVKKDAAGSDTCTFREAYSSWRRAFGPEYWPYLARAIRAWSLIKDWLAAHYPAVLTSIQPGLTEDEVREVEAGLGFGLPPAVKVLYRLHDGQVLKFDTAFDRSTLPADPGAAAAAAGAGNPGGDEGDPEEAASIFQGLFGGYSVYSHMVVTRMMPLRRAVKWRAHMRLDPNRPTLLPFACSYRVYDKMFLADAASGSLLVMRRRAGGCTLQLAAPQQGGAGPDAKDGVLRWFEEYARRLAGGWYEVAPLDEEFAEDSQAISLYPLAAPGLVEAVTRGVRVRASVVYVPEAHADRHMFAYSVRYALLDSARHHLAPGGPEQGRGQGQGQGLGGAAQAAAAAAAARSGGSSGSFGGLLGPVQQCQLTSRHWVIRDEEGRVTDEVRGEGVVGKYPVLKPGEPDFVYSSCTHQQGPRGSMEGEFQFVEGTIGRQTGPVFDVVCPAFRLDVPAFTY